MSLSQKLLEKNRKVINKVFTESKEAQKYRADTKKSFGFDPYDAAMLKEGFSFRKAAEKVQGFREANGFREAETSTIWTQLLRAGVNNVANSAYLDVAATTWKQWVTVASSKLDTEIYAPLHSVGFPGEVPEQGGLFPEVSTAGLNLKLANKKYGSIFSVSMELLEDDQTSQMQQRAQMMAEYLDILTEVLVMGKLLSPSGGATYLNFKVPVSETKPSYEANYPWTASSAPFVGGGYNKPAAYTIINQAGIQGGIQALMQQKDLLGNFMNVKPTHALHSPARRFDVAVLLNSSYYPSGAAAAGSTGGAFSVNPIQSVIEPIVTPFMPKYDGTFSGLAESWFLVDASKPAFVFQMRQGISLVPEAPNSGDGFNRELQRYRVSMRGNADFIDPRFMWLGNDGSVTS